MLCSTTTLRLRFLCLLLLSSVFSFLFSLFCLLQFYDSLMRPLPKGVEEQKTAKGRKFYIDHNTHKTSWTRPETPAAPTPKVPPPPPPPKSKEEIERDALKGAKTPISGWTKYFSDKSQKVFYWYVSGLLIIISNSNYDVWCSSTSSLSTAWAGERERE